MYPFWFQATMEILASLIRLVGMAALGIGATWLTLEFFRNAKQEWQLQIALFLGFLGIGIAMARFLSPASLGAYGIGVGLAILFWGLPKKNKAKA